MIIIDKVLGTNVKSGKLILLADTKAEVPDTGADTARLIPGYKGTLGAGSIIRTTEFETAFLRTDDHWSWKGASADNNGDDPTPAG